MPLHPDGRPLGKRLRQRDLSRRAAHLKSGAVRAVAPDIVLRHPGRAVILRVVEKPAGVGPHQILARRVLDRKIAVAVNSLEAVGPGADDDLLPQHGKTVHHDLPGVEPPGPVPGVQIPDPQPHVLGVKRGTVLEIVHNPRDGQTAGCIGLAVAHSAGKCIHEEAFFLSLISDHIRASIAQPGSGRNRRQAQKNR